MNNLDFDYLFIITEFTKEGPITHKLTPVNAFTFLSYEHKYLPKIAVTYKSEYLVLLYPTNDKNTIVYQDSVWNFIVRPEPYHVFNYIDSMDERQEGNFKSIYEEEFLQKKDAGEEVYNPFSPSNNNLNWKSISTIRKNYTKSVMPPNFTKKFRTIRNKQPYGLWQGATPLPEENTNRKSRSRKTRKNRR